MSTPAKILKPLWAVSIFWRGSDTLFSVAGFDRSAVEKKADELWADELKRAVEEDLQDLDAPSAEDESAVSDNLETELCNSGINPFYGKEIDSLGIPSENLAELEQDGITVY